MDEIDRKPNEPAGDNDTIDATLANGNKNILTGKDLQQTINERNTQQTTNLYISLQELLGANAATKSRLEEGGGGAISMEVEREFRRIFESLNVSMERMSAEVKNLSREMNTNSTVTAASIKVLEQQVKATQDLVTHTRAQIEETVAGLRMPAMNTTAENSNFRNRMLAWSQIAISIGIWVAIIMFAADRFLK